MSEFGLFLGATVDISGTRYLFMVSGIQEQELIMRRKAG